MYHLHLFLRMPVPIRRKMQVVVRRLGVLGSCETYGTESTEGIFLVRHHLIDTSLHTLRSVTIWAESRCGQDDHTGPEHEEVAL